MPQKSTLCQRAMNLAVLALLFMAAGPLGTKYSVYSFIVGFSLMAIAFLLGLSVMAGGLIWRKRLKTAEEKL